MSIGKTISWPDSSPMKVICTLFLADTIGLMLSVGISVFLKYFSFTDLPWSSYLGLWPALLPFVAVYAAMGLYSIISLGAPEEIRRVAIATAVLFPLLGMSTTRIRGGSEQFTWTLIIAMMLSVATVPLMRVAARKFFGRAGWWGYPAVILGSAESAGRILASLALKPGAGLIPVAVVDAQCTDGKVNNIPVLNEEEARAELAEFASRTYAILSSDVPTHLMRDAMERRFANFFRLILLPEFHGLSAAGVTTRDLPGHVGVEVSHGFYEGTSRVAKKALDVTIAALALVLMAPFFALIYLAILIESGRPIFYGHQRIGTSGSRFKAWKFRSMVKNGDALLEKHLAENPSARIEWEQDRKLKNDPRVTRVGNFLRRTSLDELPQLWNVLVGEMSLVGPRPVVNDEIPKYGGKIDLYYRVKGGITGLWQVSGRNDTTYEQRVALDTFYVCNWSMWLDLSILARTFTAVLFRKGSY